MGRSRRSLKQTLLLSTFAAASLFSVANAATSSPSESGTAKSAAQSSEAQTTATGATTAVTTAAATGTGTGTSTSTGTASASDSAATTASSEADSTASSMSTLSSTASSSVSTYPAASVPPTENAPFMKHSSLPDGTVFIAVGSILGGFGVAVLIWRAVVAYMLHRSIARSAMAQHLANDKAAFLPPPNAAAFYEYSDRDPFGGPIGSGLRGGSSNGGGGGAPLGGAAALGRGVRRTQRGPTPSATPSQTNLFFSPTAPGAGHASGTTTAAAAAAASNRDSRLLPAGFYAAGSASSSAGATGATSINMSSLRQDASYGQARAAGGSSPPDSPAFGARSSMLGSQNLSGSSINLSNMNRSASGRPPSAFLDDLLDENPDMFPPGGQAHHRAYSHSSQGRI